MAVVYNKQTREWRSVDDTTGYTDPWIIDPVFEDQQLAMTVGQEFWTFDGNIIKTPTFAEVQAILKARAQQRKWEDIQAERDRRKANGVKVGNYWFHTDDSSRIQQIGLVMMGNDMPSNIMWKTMTGEFVQMTPQLAQQIFQAVAAQDIALFTIAEQHRAAMLAAENPCDYNYNTGWPPTFGEG